MSLQKGGLILTDPTLLKNGIFAPVLQMLRSGSAKVRLLTAKSLKGFMFVLTVNQEDSVYRTFKHLGGGKKITSFIIKIVIITQVTNTTLTPYTTSPPYTTSTPYSIHPKKSESKETFLSEAKIQQDIWLHSIQNGRPEFSPSVANLALFDNSDSYICIAGHILPKAEDDPTRDCLQYLIREFENSNNSLGVLLMPNIKDSYTLGNYLDNFRETQSEKNKALGNTISNIVRLGIMYKFIHLDLHTDNSLVVPGTKKSFIIDFGTATNLFGPVDEYLRTDDDKRQLLIELSKFENEFLDLATHKTTPTVKIAFIESVCRKISDIGRSINQPMHQGYHGDHTAYQMDWIEGDVYGSPYKDSIFMHAFDKLAADYLKIDSKSTKETITRYMKQDMLFDLTKTVSEYSSNFNIVKSVTGMDYESDDDDDEGKGKTKKHRNKKSKKSKKSRKSKKSYKSKY